jgi:23S rRNA (uridine2552-2'-O)-methyltransferase
VRKKPYIPNDKWSQRAAEMGFRARSVFKLQELDDRIHLLRPDMKVLDIGAAPGSWLQYVSQKIGPRGRAIGIDLQEIEPIADNVHTYQLDLNDASAMRDVLEREQITYVDLVLSDIAPNTTGVKDIDQYQSVELTRLVLDLGHRILDRYGHCVCKVFRGGDFDRLLQEAKRKWFKVKIAHVKATRESSSEVYLIATK